ncbi:MAG: iron chelate uptake ABC transporter family permease subunit, partial [Thermoguttaceae bacterium]|nr:iron chelate uptake ABC transporter family permease subunit [Thermoguttaceae bacterium]
MKTRTTLIFLLLAAAAVLLAWVNIYAGEVGLSHGRLAHILFSRDLSDVESKIVWDIRLPRVVAAAVLGGA